MGSATHVGVYVSADKLREVTTEPILTELLRDGSGKTCWLIIHNLTNLRTGTQQCKTAFQGEVQRILKRRAGLVLPYVSSLLPTSETISKTIHKHFTYHARRMFGAGSAM